MSLGGILTDLDGFTGSLAGTLVPNSGGNIVDLRSEQNLAAWYDASNSANLTVDSVGRVSQWNDTSTFASRHLTQATAGSQPIYLPWSGQNYGYLPGVAGNYFSAPDSAAVSITGDIDVQARIRPRSWAPAARQTIVGKWNDTGNQRSFLFDLTPTGALQVVQSTTGIDSIRIWISPAATGFTDNNAGWVRFTLDVDNGSSGSTVQFYTSTDGVSWSVLGAAQVVATAANTFDGTSPLENGSANAGTAQNLSGDIFITRVYNGIGGTLVAAFDPSRATDGASSFVAATGETWTTNTSGGKPAQIVGRSSVLFDGVDDFLKTAPFTLNQPETVYFVGKQVSWTLDEIIYDGDNIASLGRMVLYQTTASPGLSMFAGTVLPVASLAVGSVGVVASVFNGASSLTTINRGTATTGNAGTNNGGGFTLGVEASTTGRWSNIQVSAVAIFSTAHDARTRARVINYLVSRYSIPV